VVGAGAVGEGEAICGDPAASEGAVSVTSATTTEAIQLFCLTVKLNGSKYPWRYRQSLDTARCSVVLGC